jgi:hypothetical protein
MDLDGIHTAIEKAVSDCVFGIQLPGIASAAEGKSPSLQSSCSGLLSSLSSMASVKSRFRLKLSWSCESPTSTHCARSSVLSFALP